MAERKSELRLDATKVGDHVERQFTQTLAFGALKKMKIVDDKGDLLKQLPIYLRVQRVTNNEIDRNYVFRIVAINAYDITLTTWGKHTGEDERLDQGGTNKLFWNRNFYWATKEEYFTDTPD